MRSVNSRKQKKWSVPNTGFILSLCLTINLSNFANEPVAPSSITVFDALQNMLVVGVSRSGRQVTLDFHGPDEPYLWRRIVETSGAFFLCDAMISENKMVVTGSFSGMLDLGALTLDTGGSLSGFYAVFDERGRLVSAGQIESRSDVLVSDVTQDHFGLTLEGTLDGIGFRLPIFKGDLAVERESLIDLTDHDQHLLRIRIFPGETEIGPDKDGEPDILVGENPGSNDNPNGDPPPENPPV